MLKSFLYALINLSYSDVMPQQIGDSHDQHNCLVSAGYSWCDSSSECIRKWLTPCEDDYEDCQDCLHRQRIGENIACPLDCDMISINDPCSLDCPPQPMCPLIDMYNNNNCKYTPPLQDKCNCIIECGSLDCSNVPLLNEGDICRLDISIENHFCNEGLECVNIKGTDKKNTIGVCKSICNTIRDDNGNCVDQHCNSWFDGCNTCNVFIQPLHPIKSYITPSYISDCSEISCNNILDPICRDYTIPDNCASWYDGCNTCSIVNGNPSICTLMVCFTMDKPDCLSYYMDNSGH